MKLPKQDPKINAKVIEVMQKSRRQTYTPETLCQIQKIIETQYFYYWSMDMKKEEYLCDLFTEDFVYNCFGAQKLAPEYQAKRSKYVNRNMVTSHMSHQPLIWLMSETEARGIFLYEDHHCYKDLYTVENHALYCNDFRRGEDGLWRISVLRLCYRKMNGQLKDMLMPDDWVPKRWEPEF